MGRPKKDKKTELSSQKEKEQVVKNETIGDIIEEMKNVSIMSTEEVSKIPAPDIKTNKRNNIEEQKESMAKKTEETVEGMQDFIEEKNEKPQESVKTAVEQKEKKPNIINENKIVSKRNKNAREMYGYDWCGLCYDD